jgi:hypothetical protein
MTSIHGSLCIALDSALMIKLYDIWIYKIPFRDKINMTFDISNIIFLSISFHWIKSTDKYND